MSSTLLIENAKYTLFRRGGIYYSQDSATGQQKSLRTCGETEGLKLINALNETHRQLVLNLQIECTFIRPGNIPSIDVAAALT